MEKKGRIEGGAEPPLLDITRFPSRRFRLQLWRAISVRRTGYVSRNFSNYCVITPVINYTYRDNTARRARILFTRFSRRHARVRIIFRAFYYLFSFSDLRCIGVKSAWQLVSAAPRIYFLSLSLSFSLTLTSCILHHIYFQRASRFSPLHE